MRLFYYTEKKKVEDAEETDSIPETGYSFDVDSVVMTYPVKDGLAVILNRNVDKLNPVEYEYKIDPKTKQKVPVKIKKFEVTSEPITIELKEVAEIKAFFEMTGGPTVVEK
jgi:hypothetical protein